MAAAGGSQATIYGALIVGGVLTVAGFTGHGIGDILAGKSSPLKGLVAVPEPASNAGSTSFASLLSGTPKGGTVAGNPSSAIEWAKSVVGISGGSGAVARWDAAIGQSPGIPWCSAFVSAILRHAGIKSLPSNPAYSGAWLSWKGGTKLPINAKTINEPGNLLIFDWGDGGITDHVAYVIGNGKQIQGNDSNDSVGISSISSTASHIVGVVKPKYPRPKKTEGFFSGRSGRV